MTGGQLDHYLARIRYFGALTTDSDVLSAVHCAHAAAIAFEDFDVVLGRFPRIDEQAVFAKLVVNRRGGYCFETNRLLEWALRTLGFTVRPLLAKVLVPGILQTQTHYVLVVDTAAGRWIADCGFGPLSLQRPMLLEDGFEDNQAGCHFHMENSGEGRFLLSLDSEEGGRMPLFTVDLAGSLAAAELAAAHHYCATSDASIFTAMPLAAIVAGNTRKSLIRSEFRTASDGSFSSHEATDEGDFRARCAEWFNVGLSYSDATALFAAAIRLNAVPSA
jgi:N-hydroxyarylamine O-acetyltransferase